MADKKRYGFVIDVSRCIDCRACLVACRVENNVPTGYTRIWVRDLGVRGTFPDLQHAFVPTNCNHCQHPPCVDVCPSGATWKDPDHGLVLVDEKACIGCRQCVLACPYDARYTNPETHVVDKCNACLQRVEVGLEPACVATCVGGSRMFGDLNDPASGVCLALREARSVQRINYTQGEIDTQPNIIYINGDVQDESIAARPPEYTSAEGFWRKIAIPAVLVGVGAAAIGQAAAFTKQLIDGEKEFEE
jgi:tetrathionate reductase subunit B